jgi:hypothetical protein
VNAVKRIVTAVVIAIPALLVPGPGALARADDEGWEFALQQDGIDVYTRQSEGSDRVEFRGVVTVPDPPEAVLAVLEEVERYPDWYARCRTARTLERFPPDARIVYMEIDLPFPAGDRDAVVRVERSREPGTLGDTIRVRISTAADAHPEVDGFIRMPRVEGGWLLEPGEAGTRVQLQQLNDPGGSLPSWLTNMLVTDQPLTTLRGLRRVLAERRKARGDAG